MPLFFAKALDSLVCCAFHQGIKIFMSMLKIDITIIITTFTISGGYEMTDMDVLKLQRMYGCDGSCGGYAKSEGGGFSNNIIVSILFHNCLNNISATGRLEGKNSDRESPCEWILETSPGKVEKENYFDQFAFFFLRNILNTPQGIEIAISELTGPTDCSTDYLEVGHNFHLGSANFQRM